GEGGTPATDVFQLGLIAHELLTGQVALAGGGMAEIERRALAADLPALEVPRPLAKVVRRALARSPFERFPDAGSLADAVDAAMRQSPLPGDRRDLAGLVRAALDEQAAMHESQLSGALRLPVPAPPRAAPGAAPASSRPAAAPAIQTPLRQTAPRIAALAPGAPPAASAPAAGRPASASPASAPPASAPIVPKPIGPTGAGRRPGGGFKTPPPTTDRGIGAVAPRPETAPTRV